MRTETVSLKLTPARIEVACKNCGIKFVRNRKHVAREKDGPYCSQSCSKSYQGRGSRNPNYRGGPIHKTCTICRSAFSVAGHAAATAKYCSKACATLGAIGRPSPKRQLPDKGCAICGSSFQPTRRTSKYCSNDCRHTAQSTFVRGERVGTYIHGNSKKAYPRGWNNRLKMDVRSRDGDCCVLCLTKTDPTGRDLSVHHIDYHKANLDPANLVTLCSPCHGMMHNRISRMWWPQVLSALVTEIAGA